MAVKERKFVKANARQETKVEVTPRTKEERRQKATGKRIAAVVFWLLALACEVAFILTLNKTLYIEKNMLYWQLGFLIVDAILVIVGAQFWKRANDVDPASEANKLKFFLWNQMGLIAAAVCLAPLVILLITNKDLDKKTKNILLPVAAAALVIAGLFSWDWNPMSEEEMTHTIAEYSGDTVYYTRFGKSYHLNPDCQALKNSSVIFEGTIQDALDAGRHDPCDFCVNQ
ncbi:MAG: hypothetical protein II414_03410 [Erysipelotrichaceae bacterium]|nr:hypothetical protein [Erysipelotrichaceae bacterium]